MKTKILKINIFIALLVLSLISFSLSACGKKSASESKYEIVDGKVVEISPSSSDNTENSTHAVTDDGQIYTEQPASVEQAGTNAFDGTAYSDGVAVDFPNEEYNSIQSVKKAEVENVRNLFISAANACFDIYNSAEKGSSYNINLSAATVAEMIIAMGNAGYSAVDSLGKLDMQNFQQMDEFGRSILGAGDIRGTYFVVYNDGHISAFDLSRESGIWHLISMSGEFMQDGSLHIYGEGRYGIGGVKYTDRGWLIYSRNTSDFDENQKSNTGVYTMVRVLPYNAEMRALCSKYVEPVGYFENNLFTVDWSEANFGPVDFNSLYAYLFGMYNGTEMLSAYNVRQFYKAVSGSRLYLVPADVFDNTVTAYFNIDRAVLKNISDYSNKLGGYFFVGYNTDYYNITPRTPLPEVVSYSHNTNGTITMTVDAINPWYGTDRAFEHVLTVYPNGNTFKYISNDFIDRAENIVPETKLSVMLDVYRSGINY